MIKSWSSALCALVLLSGSVQAQWVESPGQGWVDLAVYHLDTRSAFEFDGVSRSFFAEGHAISTSAFVTVALGLVPGVDAWVQAPYQRLRFDDAREDRLRAGVGDTRLYARFAPLGLFGSNVPFAIRGGVKIPVGDFAVDSEIIPLGDGQTDWELMAEVGHSFYPVPLYVNGWLGYRWRRVNVDARRDFGDEGFFLAQIGGDRGPWGAQLIIEGMTSLTTPVIEGVRLPNAERAIYQVTPKVAYTVGGGSFNAGVRLAVKGMNLPSGPAFVVGYFRRIGLGG